MKTCPRCIQTKPLDEFYATINAKRKRTDGWCKQCRRDDRARMSKTNCEKTGLTYERRSDLKKRYGITPERYLALIASQNNSCAICKQAFSPGARIHVDHDHSCCPTKRTCGQCVRGLLCGGCNTGMGHMKDDPTITQAATDYLIEWSSQKATP